MSEPKAWDFWDKVVGKFFDGDQIKKAIAFERLGVTPSSDTLDLFNGLIKDGKEVGSHRNTGNHPAGTIRVVEPKSGFRPQLPMGLERGPLEISASRFNEFGPTIIAMKVTHMVTGCMQSFSLFTDEDGDWKPIEFEFDGHRQLTCIWPVETRFETGGGLCNFSYEDLDDWQKDDCSEESQAIKKEETEKAGLTFYGAVLRGPNDYRGLLDDMLPEKHIRLRMRVTQWISTGKQNPLGANYSDHVTSDITAEINEPMTLREAIPHLQAAWSFDRETLDAEGSHYFIERIELGQDEDEVPVLYMTLGT